MIIQLKNLVKNFPKANEIIESNFMENRIDFIWEKENKTLTLTATDDEIFGEASELFKIRASRSESLDEKDIENAFVWLNNDEKFVENWQHFTK